MIKTQNYSLKKFNEYIARNPDNNIEKNLNTEVIIVVVNIK